MITLVLLLLFYFSKKFGASSNLETICSIGGTGRFVNFFKFDWIKKLWNLLFLLGVVLDGFITYQWLTPKETIVLNSQTIRV